MAKSRALAWASLVFGLTFWIPMLNVLFGILALVLGIKALSRARAQPESYGGKAIAVIGIILGAIPLLFSVAGLGLCVSGWETICYNMGLWFLA
ncbi:DUF4190 domain-containing protein [Candidatus Woesearchaeota archaeon]|nr:DUF4190 domain-containing protein [Candidatus Woesearchaeota archaeon]